MKPPQPLQTYRSRRTGKAVFIQEIDDKGKIWVRHELSKNGPLSEPELYAHNVHHWKMLARFDLLELKANS